MEPKKWSGLEDDLHIQSVEHLKFQPLIFESVTLRSLRKDLQFTHVLMMYYMIFEPYRPLSWEIGISSSKRNKVHRQTWPDRWDFNQPGCEDDFSHISHINVQTKCRSLRSLLYNLGLHHIFLESTIWVFPKIGVPQNGWFIMGNPIKMDDFGVKKTYFWFNTHMDGIFTKHFRYPKWRYETPI